jgi:hypothetical protein
MKYSIILVGLFVHSMGGHLVGQAESGTQDSLNHPFAARFNAGGALLNSWNGLAGDDVSDAFFYKPSVGVALQAEVFPWKTLGFGTGVGFVTKGPGRFTTDLDDSLGNPDSTHRQHYSFRCLDIPLYVVLRSPGLSEDRIRLLAKAGAGLTYNLRTVSVFHSVEDGFHDKSNVSPDFFKTDFYALASAGVEVNAGGVNTLQVVFFSQTGFGNVFEPGMAFGSLVGKNRNYGLQLVFMY